MGRADYNPPRLYLPTEWHGLVRIIHRRAEEHRTAKEPKVPFGWTVRLHHECYVWRVMPLWLAWAMWLWDRRWTLHALGVASGFRCLSEEGGYYRDGWWTLKPWETFDRFWHRYSVVCGETGPFPILNRYERFARWLERFYNACPRWV